VKSSGAEAPPYSPSPDSASSMLSPEAARISGQGKIKSDSWGGNGGEVEEWVP